MAFISISRFIICVPSVKSAHLCMVAAEPSDGSTLVRGPTGKKGYFEFEGARPEKVTGAQMVALRHSIWNFRR